MPRLEYWRRLPPDGGASEQHVVQSDALSRLATEPSLWWHWTERTTILLGAGQTNVDIDLEACTAAGISVIKRSSGGTTVFADRALLGLDVVLPAGHPLILDDVVESYRWLGEVWVGTLGLLGASGHLVTVAEARGRSRPSQSVETVLRLACFGSISPYEVLVDGRKVVGLSQIRRGGRVLLQCGVYLHFEPVALTALLKIPDRDRAARELAQAASGLDTATGRAVTRADVLHAFSTVLHDDLGVTEVAGEWSNEELTYVHASAPV